MSDESTLELSIEHLFVPDEPVFDSSIVKDSLHVQLALDEERTPLAASEEQHLEFTTTEPHYYFIRPTLREGDTSCFSSARRQIRQLFALLGDREDLDLYEIIANQLDLLLQLYSGVSPVIKRLIDRD